MSSQSENERNKAVVDAFYQLGIQGRLTDFAQYLTPTSLGPHPTISRGEARTPARRSFATKFFPVFPTCSTSRGSATSVSSPRTACRRGHQPGC
jgi:hypothetical protein